MYGMAMGFERHRHRRFLGVVQCAKLQVRIDHAVDVVLAYQAHDVVGAALVGRETGAVVLHIALGQRMELAFERGFQ